MRVFKSLCFIDIYLFLWIVYLLQYFVFGSTGTLYSRVLILLLLVTSFAYAFLTVVRLRIPLYLKGVVLLLTMFTIYGVFLMLSPDTIRYDNKIIASHYYLQNIYISLLPLFPFYYFTRKGRMTKQKVSFWVVVLFVVAILEYFQGRQQYLEMYNDEDFTNNMGYEIVALIPLIFLLRKKLLVQFISLGIIFFFPLLSMKRGAILIGLVCTLVSILYLLRDTKGARKAFTIVVFGIGIIIAVGFVNHLISTNAYFASRIDSTLAGDTSQRSIIYAKMMHYFLEQSNVGTILFGSGANATIKILGGFAHNDWLEIAINQGFLGLTVYLIYWIFFFHTWRSIHFDSDIRMAVLISFLIYFLMTFFSMSYDCMSLSSTFCLGICMGELSKHQYC